MGRPHPLVEVAVDAPPGEVGEVLARGPTLMDGYWGLEAQTAEALAGGWLHTGDLGRFDQRGALHLAGRAKDMIVSGGEKVYPLEVERLIRSLPGVADVALIGVPDPEWGESAPGLRRARPRTGRGGPPRGGDQGVRAPPPGRLQVPPLRGVRRLLARHQRDEQGAEGGPAGAFS